MNQEVIGHSQALALHANLNPYARNLHHKQTTNYTLCPDYIRPTKQPRLTDSSTYQTAQYSSIKQLETQNPNLTNSRKKKKKE